MFMCASQSLSNFRCLAKEKVAAVPHQLVTPRKKLCVIFNFRGVLVNGGPPLM